MGYTAPRTWVAGEVHLASQLNTHLRDMFNYLLDASGYIVLQPSADGQVFTLKDASATSRVAFNTSSGVLQVNADNSYFGGYAFGAGTGVARLRVNTASGVARLMAEGDAANVDLALRQKGTGQFYLQNDGASTLVQITNAGGISAVGPNHYFGDNALGATGSRLRINSVSTGVVDIIAESSAAACGILYKDKGDAGHGLCNSGGTYSLFVHTATPSSGDTALSVRYDPGSGVTSQRVTVGASDSGGAGYRVLRVPN